jgi:hypothetical protein
LGPPSPPARTGRSDRGDAALNAEVLYDAEPTGHDPHLEAAIHSSVGEAARQLRIAPIVLDPQDRREFSKISGRLAEDLISSAWAWYPYPTLWGGCMT